MKLTPRRLKAGLHQRCVHTSSNRRWQKLSQEVESQSVIDTGVRPVIFFNASTRIQSMSQNAAYSFITALALKTAGVPVIQFACQSGLERCLLGSNRDRFEELPPCEHCIRQSQAVFRSLDTHWLKPRSQPELEAALSGLNVEELATFTWQDAPLGFWALNSLRWMMRRYSLNDDSLNRAFFRAFIQSGWNVYTQFKELIEQERPQAAVIFNGIFTPEAAARHACLEKGVRVITHEVGLRPYSAFFTTGEATAYPLQIPPDFQLTPEMNQKLEEDLSSRFRGDFSMAGIRFWREIKPLDSRLVERMKQFSKVVPVFSNVIFDTSQVHANTIFPHMFAWLDHVYATARAHPEILFVLRAHPDECRPGKESRESVAQWVEQSGFLDLPNAAFYDANEFINSYELIRLAHLVLVYNSTIGLEAAILGKTVIAGGRARFTQLETSFYPSSLKDYQNLLEDLLRADQIETPVHFSINARRFLYFQLYASSLDFSDYLEEDGVWKGYVRPKNFSLDQLRPEHSITVKTLLDGILSDGTFTLPV